MFLLHHYLALSDRNLFSTSVHLDAYLSCFKRVHLCFSVQFECSRGFCGVNSDFKCLNAPSVFSLYISTTSLLANFIVRLRFLLTLV